MIIDKFYELFSRSEIRQEMKSTDRRWKKFNANIMIYAGKILFRYKLSFELRFFFWEF